jgi:hypothetical protein
MIARNNIGGEDGWSHREKERRKKDSDPGDTLRELKYE